MGKVYIETGAVPTDVSSTRKYMQEIKKRNLLTQDEEKALAVLAQSGDGEAINTLIERNLRFVVQVAKQYQGMGVPLADLISAGNIGLYEAATRFDPAKKVKFISFAVWYVRSEITKELNDHGRTVRIPSHKTKTEEYSTKSIHNPIGEDEEGETYADRFLPDEVGQSKRDLADLKELIEVAITKLPMKEAIAIKMFYGIGLEYPKCTADIAEAMDLTVNRVLQLLRSGEKHLREMSGIKLLEQYL